MRPTLFCIRPKGFNVGNDVISLGLEHFIQRAFGQSVNLITLPATSRYESHAKAGLTARTVHEINQYGHGVIVGGGNLYENGELEVDPWALETLEPPLMLFSLSSGRIYNHRRELVRRTDAMRPELIRALDKRADFSLARDERTTSYLRELGCEKPVTGGCPTVYLNQTRTTLPPLPEADRGGVLISVRAPNLMNIPLPLQSRVRRDLEGLIELCRNRGHGRVRLLCHDQRDISFAASFSGVEYVYLSDARNYLSLLAHSDLNITFRLHSFLPCLSLNVPTVAVSYDERASALIDTLGFGDWNINLVRESDLVSAVAGRLDNLNELPAHRARATAVWDRLERQMSQTFTAFAEHVSAFAGEA